MDDFIYPMYKNATASVATTSSCRIALSQLLCFVCDPHQIAFVELSGGAVQLRVCDDTCVNLWEDCSTDPAWVNALQPYIASIGQPTSENYARASCDMLSNLDGWCVPRSFYTGPFFLAAPCFIHTHTYNTHITHTNT